MCTTAAGAELTVLEARRVARHRHRAAQRPDRRRRPPSPRLVDVVGFVRPQLQQRHERALHLVLVPERVTGDGAKVGNLGACPTIRLNCTSTRDT